MKLYQVLEWNEHFENSKSRERESCSFVCVPNQQAGLGFSRIMAEADGAAIYGIWCLLLGSLSRQKKPRNGWLTHNGHQTGTAWAPCDLALLWRRPVPEILRALAFLSSAQVGWLSEMEHIVEDGVITSARQVPAKYPSGIVKEEKEGIEGSTPPIGKIWPPTLEMVLKHARNPRIAQTEEQATKFWNHYQSVGWIDAQKREIIGWEEKQANWKKDESNYGNTRSSSGSKPAQRQANETTLDREKLSSPKLVF